LFWKNLEAKYLATSYNLKSKAFATNISQPH